MTSQASTRTSALVRFALPALLLLLAPAASAEVIDDFETAQGVLTDSGTSVVTDNGADVILGDHRELEIELVEGTAGVTVEATAGALSFDATAGADTRAVATVVWDADTNTTVFDGDGLGGVDLTDNNETAFRIEVDAASADTQILVEVFTNDGNSSKAGLRLPAVTATTDFYLSYADFIANLGTGADFANVGAIVMRILGTNVAADIAFFETVGPSLTVTKIDIDPNDDMDFGTDPVVPGDTIRYRVDITNDGGLAQQVDLADTVDANTTFTMDSLTATPVALVDTVAVLGNVTRTVADPGVLANDQDPDNDALFVRVSNSDTMSAEGGTIAWNDTGSDDQGEGGFQYFPPAGFRGVDSFAYELEDADGETAAGQVTVILDRIIWFVDDDHAGPFEGTLANPFADFAQLDDTLNDVDQDGDIIFVFAHSGGNYTHAGLELEPGQSLIGEGEGLTVDATVIVPAGASALIHAPDAGAGLQHGATLTMNNTIRGVTFGTTEGHAITGSNFGTLTVSNTTVTGAGGILDVDNGTLDVTLASSSSSAGPGFGIDFDTVDGSFDAGSTTITGGATGGIRVANGGSGAAFDFGGASVTGVPAGVDLSASGMASFTFDSLDVTTTGTALNVNTAGSVTIGGVLNTLETTASGAAILASMTEMTGGWTFDNVTSDGSPTHGISLSGMTGGNLLVTGATDINDPVNNGIDVEVGGARTYDFGATDISGAGVAMGAVGHGVDVTTSNSMSTFVFDSLAITTDNGGGLLANSSGTVNIAGTGNTISATTGPALDAASTTFDDVPGGAVTGVTFATLSSANSPTTGVNIVGVNGSITGTAGSITGATGTAFNVGTAANTSGGSNNVTYGGSITNTAARSVSVQERNGGAVTLSGTINDTGTGILVTNNNNGVANSVTFSGSSKVVNTGASPAITLTNNANATVGFTGGGLDVDTTTAVGFTASGGGTINASGAGNSVTSSSAKAVDIDGVLTGITFASISSTGSSSQGVDLTNLVDTSAFAVTGTTTVTNATSEGLLINSAVNAAIDVDFTGTTTVSNAGGFGIRIDRADTNGVPTASDIDFGVVNVNNRNTTGVFLDNLEGTTNFGVTTIANPNNALGYGIRAEDSSAAIVFGAANVSDANTGTAETDAAGIPTNEGDGDGIFLSAITGSFAVNGGTIANSGGDGIDSRSSANLSLSGVTIDNVGVDVAGADAVHVINLLGTNQISTSVFTRFSTTGAGGVNVISTGTSSGSLVVSSSRFHNADGGTAALSAEARNSSQVTVRVDDVGGAANDSIFEDLFQLAFSATAIDSGRMTAILRDSAIRTAKGALGNNGVLMASSSSALFDFIIEDNDLDDVLNQATFTGVISFATSAGPMIGKIRRNDLDGTAGSCIRSICTLTGVLDVTVDENTCDDVGRYGLSIRLDDSSSGDVRVTDNQFGVTSPVGNDSAVSPSRDGMEFRIRDAAATMDVFLSNNDVVISNSAAEAVDIDVEDSATLNMTVDDLGGTNDLRNNGSGPDFRAESEDAGATLCVDLDGQTTRTYDLVETAGTFTVEDLATVAADNPGATINVGAGITDNGGGCPTPPAEPADPVG